jgi:hypothetical protein
MWQEVQVLVATGTVRGRYRMEGDQVVLEWRGGRIAERCGMLKPEYVAVSRLRQLASAAIAA